MSKTIYIELTVPSNSRPEKLHAWLNSLLAPHRMSVLTVTEDTLDSTAQLDLPEGHVLVIYPRREDGRQEVSIWKDLKLIDLKSGEIRATVVKENNAGVASLKGWNEFPLTADQATMPEIRAELNRTPKVGESVLLPRGTTSAAIPVAVHNDEPLSATTSGGTNE